MKDYFSPRRYWKWTRWTLIAAGVFFCVLYVQSYRNEWSAAERVDLWVYLESGVWGSLSEQSLTSYRLLEGVTAKKQTLLVTGDEMEAAAGENGEPEYRLTAEGSRAGMCVWSGRGINTTTASCIIFCVSGSSTTIFMSRPGSRFSVRWRCWRCCCRWPFRRIVGRSSPTKSSGKS